MVNTMHANYRNEYETPPEFFRALDHVFDFHFDLFASHQNALCEAYNTKEGEHVLPCGVYFSRRWRWANPPYGKGLDKLLTEKVVNPYLSHGARTVALLPANMDVGWMHELVLPWANIVWIRGRLQFLLDGKRPVNPKTGKASGNSGANLLAIYGPNLLRCRAVAARVGNNEKLTRFS